MNTNKTIVGQMVRYSVDGKVVFAGLCRYVTADDWAGIRTEGDRVDEAPLTHTTLSLLNS